MSELLTCEGLTKHYGANPHPAGIFFNKSHLLVCKIPCFHTAGPL